MKRIFYFNITYGCNSNCVFCYSHNTYHNSTTYNEISFLSFFDYLEKQQLNVDDRVIINGGEPFLHSEIELILSGLMKYYCEVLIYTNGRLLSKYDLSGLSSKFRFIIPIHGYESIHDNITKSIGSYRETLEGLEMLTKKTKCLVDIKIIINSLMISEDPTGKKLIKSLRDVRFNNAVHITKMADTITSIKNKCKSVTNSDAAYYTNLLYEYFKAENCIIKLFDTCILGISFYEFDKFDIFQDKVVVYFKDNTQFRETALSRKYLECMVKCKYSDKCKSAVDEYKVLEYCDGRIYENLE